MSQTARLILAFDFGLRRIGVATGNLLTRTASPLTTITRHARPPWREIETLLADWRPDRIVVGQPGGGAGPELGNALAEFNAGLAQRFPGPIEQVDESHSSTAAAESLREGRSKGIYNRRLNKERIDSHAACLIAEQWMNRALESD